MRVVHVISSLGLETGGPARSVVQLVDALSQLPDCQVTLVSALPPRGRALPSSQSVIRRVREVPSRLHLKLGMAVRKELARLEGGAEPLIIHSHGSWLPANHWAARTARRLDVPLVIQPRGMLEPWALQHKGWRKRAALALYQQRDLRAAAMFVATAESEYRSIRSLGLSQPVAVIPNGVSFEPAAGLDRRGAVDGSGLRTALFLSRVHVKKGILNLLQAWARSRPPGWRLVIAGPDDGGHLRQAISEARTLGIDSTVEFAGELDGERKSQAYSRADLFVLPTLSENFGIVVAEALAHGVPVITTRGAPWADLETYRCGWWVEIGVEPLAEALRSATSMNDAERRAMGERGREYVRRFDWDELARRTLAAYRWILGEGEVPNCVRVD